MHDGFVHYDRTHPDQYIIMYDTTMNDRIVTDRNIISNCCATLPECAMNNSSILYVHFVSHPDKIYISPDHGVEPGAAVITHHDITHDGGIRRNETVFSKRGKFVLY